MAFPCVYPKIHHHLIHGSEIYSYERSIADESEMQNFEILGQKNKSQKSYGFSKSWLPWHLHMSGASERISDSRSASLRYGKK